MPLTTAAIGLVTDPIEHAVDERWTMAYSAALGDHDAVYVDTSRADGVVAHPLFAICPEWPVALASRDQLRERGLTAEEFPRGVHASQDCHVYRLICPGDRLSTRATVVSIEARRPGALVTTCFDTLDQDAELVCRTFSSNLYRGVELNSVGNGDMADHSPRTAVPASPDVMHSLSTTTARVSPLAVPAGLAHTYTECARIWNPIHTDVRVAREAGLPDIILHGSATLALAVSEIVRQFADGDPHQVTRIGGQFRGMVLLPSTLQQRSWEPLEDNNGRIVPFAVDSDSGAPVIANGYVVLKK
jgi:acyl dehydratase